MTTEHNNLKGSAYPNVYPNENETIPYSPRKEFGFMQQNTTDSSTGLTRPNVYPNENETIPYSPRKEFGFMQQNTTDSSTGLTRPNVYPNVYPDENETIPYSPRKEFGFMQQNTASDRLIKLESMRDMPIDQIVELYRNGYRIETSQTSTIVTASNGVSVSSDAILLIGAGLLIYMFLRR